MALSESFSILVFWGLKKVEWGRKTRKLWRHQVTYSTTIGALWQICKHSCLTEIYQKSKENTLVKQQRIFGCLFYVLFHMSKSFRPTWNFLFCFFVISFNILDSNVITAFLLLFPQYKLPHILFLVVLQIHDENKAI